MITKELQEWDITTVNNFSFLEKYHVLRNLFMFLIFKMKSLLFLLLGSDILKTLSVPTISLEKQEVSNKQLFQN